MQCPLCDSMTERSEAELDDRLEVRLHYFALQYGLVLRLAEQEAPEPPLTSLN